VEKFYGSFFTDEAISPKVPPSFAAEYALAGIENALDFV
jgi:hypothetical protein